MARIWYVEFRQVVESTETSMSGDIFTYPDTVTRWIHQEQWLELTRVCRSKRCIPAPQNMYVLKMQPAGMCFYCGLFSCPPESGRKKAERQSLCPMVLSRPTIPSSQKTKQLRFRRSFISFHGVRRNCWDEKCLIYDIFVRSRWVLVSSFQSSCNTMAQARPF